MSTITVCISAQINRGHLYLAINEYNWAAVTSQDADHQSTLGPRDRHLEEMLFFLSLTVPLSLSLSVSLSLSLSLSLILFCFIL